MPTLSDVLTMLATGVGIGAVLAFLLERVAWFQKLSPAWKTWGTLGVCLLLPLLGWAAASALGYLAWPATVQGWAETLFHELQVGFLAWAASQGWHLTEKAVRG
jgi:hypothetical protein